MPTDAAIDPALPKSIAGRRVVRLLSEQPGCVTYLTRQADGRREVVKVLPGKSGAEAIFNRCRRLAALQHTGVVPLEETHPNPQGGWLVVRSFIEGDSLADLLKQGPLDKELAVEIMAPVLETLDHAHRCGVMHGSFKASNILIDHAGVAHLADFRLAAHQCSPGEAPATTAASCNCCHAEGDVWAAGAVLFELLTGKPLPGGADAAGLSRELADLGAGPQAGALEKICERCLDADPRRRYASVADLLQDVRRGEATPAPVFAAPEPEAKAPTEPVVSREPQRMETPAAPKESAPEISSPPGKSSTTVWIALGIVAILAAMIVLWAVLR